MGQGAVAVLHVETGDLQCPHILNDLRSNGVRRTHIQRTVRACRLFELTACRRRPSSFPADPVHLIAVVGPQFFTGLFVTVGDMTRRVHCHRQLGMPELGQRAMVEVDERFEPGRFTADDGQHQRYSVSRRAYHRLRRATDTDPGGQPTLRGFREHLLAGQRRPVTTSPGDRALGSQLGEQVQFLGEQLLVLREVVAEQRERFGERAAPQDDLRPATRDRVESSEALVHADRII